MPRKSRFGKDHYGAALLILMGLGALMEGIKYHVGSPNRMGAGFVPVVLGVILALVGVAIAVTAGPDSPPTDELHKPHPPEWRGWFCILGGVIAVVLLLFRGRLRQTLWNVWFILQRLARFEAPYRANPELDVTSDKSVKLPHGAVIALGALAYLAIV